MTSVYLDIETDFARQITVFGFLASGLGYVQLVGAEITASRIRRELPKTGRLFTFNGHCFDLPCIKRRFGLDLRDRFESIDLRYPCKKAGLTGGQKAIERRLKIKRTLDNLDGRAAIYLWQAHLRGRCGAIDTLLEYNREDLDGMRQIHRHLVRRGVL